MKERPILFSGPMIRAILAGQKTVTRRVVKQQDRIRLNNDVVEYLNYFGNWQEWVNNAKSFRCPYGVPGERLWVRETFRIVRDPDGDPGEYSYQYRADGDTVGTPHWKPSIFMPKEASRITLEVVSVRVERLKDISDDDATAEGVDAAAVESYRRAGADRPPAHAYRDLWESINGPGSWDTNPWVWRVEFKKANP